MGKRGSDTRDDDDDDSLDDRKSTSSGHKFTFECSQAQKDSFLESEKYLSRNLESLPASVTNYPKKFGRTYHAYQEGSYNFPNDEEERERLSRQHEAVHIALDERLYLAPLSKEDPPRRILDVATGTGDWAIAMGDEFPSSYVYGTDLSPIQPEMVPPNTQFIIQDATEPWNCDEPYDYIHTRLTSGSWRNYQTEIVQQAFDNLNPGGWFESQELIVLFESDDGSLAPDGPVSQWIQMMHEASVAVGRPLTLAHSLRQAYEDVGFVDVQERVFRIPMNGWPVHCERQRMLGEMWIAMLLDGLSGFTLALFDKAFGMTPAATEVSLVPVRRELADTNVHGYMRVFVVWGRKPFANEMET